MITGWLFYDSMHTANAANTNPNGTNVDGNNNTAVGDTALFSNVSGINNTAIGAAAPVREAF